ncbi:hypothetical protein DRO69_08885 [Candidatus Bathyarchaeota archaeon]|nr:MAG: hypothetical protein DRO69_08885 [Candidatus Bathyarchaeota archaeon]
MQGSFDKKYLLDEFEKVASDISKPLSIFIIGGGGLAFYGLKEATKDIDVVVQTPEELNVLKQTLMKLGYSTPGPNLITKAYREMQANEILENEDGFRWDIFVGQVCKALIFSEAMRSRSTEIYKKGFLTIFLASKEDIFFFKEVTEREADLDDMRLLAESGLNWDIIDQECQSQSALTGRLWENALYQKLIDLKEKHHIETPIEKVIRKRAEEKLIEITLIEEIKKGKNTVREISKAINEPEQFVRKALNRLATKGKIKIDKTRRPYKYQLV